MLRLAERDDLAAGKGCMQIRMHNVCNYVCTVYANMYTRVAPLAVRSVPGRAWYPGGVHSSGIPKSTPGSSRYRSPRPVDICRSLPKVGKGMDEYERKLLIERIGREGATVGVSIPERVTVQGQEVDLHEFVFEIKRLETVPSGEREKVEEAKKNLRRERLQRKQRIERGEIDFEEGERLAESIVGIDRALEALESLGPSDIEGEAKRQEAMDQKRWMNFLKQVLGRDDTSSKRRGVR